MTQPILSGRSRQTTAIDKVCEAVVDEFREGRPLRFSGPDPWVQLDPDQEPSPRDTGASVYSDGPKIRMVVMMLYGETGSWRETVRYCFDESGEILKRERYLQSKPANSEVDENTWYRNGRVLKDKTKHHPLNAGKEDDSKLEDPGAPTYLSTGDLPFPIPDLWDRWVRYSRQPRHNFVRL